MIIIRGLGVNKNVQNKVKSEYVQYSLGILAHLLRIVMEPKYYGFWR